MPFCVLAIPRADDLTGAAHCCGHNVQITNMFAVAMGFTSGDEMSWLAMSYYSLFQQRK